MDAEKPAEAPPAQPVTAQPGTVVVGSVISVSPMVPIGLVAYSGPVQLVGSNWPFSMCCSCCVHCCDDPGLACYAACCSTCLGAEISEKIQNTGCCGCESCAGQWCAAYAVAAAAAMIGGLLCGAGSIAAACVWSVVLTQVRDAHKAVFQLPPDELCCDATFTSFLPLVFCDCTMCAVYQQAYFIKHTTGKDFECCCYTTCCNQTKITDTNVSLLAN